MHNREKYPEIWALKEAAEERKATLMAKREKFTRQIGDLNVKLAQLEAQKGALNDKAMADADEIRELSEEIARCAIAMGAKTASRGK